ncbi:hypothetical protein BD289DRAFT_368652 [Coniella lustricola]|uniref:Uncharacterized protein n=1 Tax=Coniella lustricola TaxID=2025994 RepID=A0A2T3A7P3_9PEZI|nr:hypothetical protein BD289DRAFT_368652 [Coniella lustricola]
MLRIEVMGSKIEHIAYHLFETRIEMADGYRYCYLPNGGRIHPFPDFLLEGCRLEPIESFFGRQVANAVFATSMYQIDALTKNTSTSCVSMRVSAAAADNAYIFIFLGHQEGIELRNTFFHLT